MRAISIIQPWATLILLGEKEYETRSWGNDYRGPVLIHASRKKSRELEFTCRSNPIVAELFKKHGLDFEKLPRGGFIGQVEMIDCLPTGSLTVGAQEAAVGDFRPGRHALKFTNPKPFQLIECAGMLGLYRIPDVPLNHAS